MKRKFDPAAPELMDRPQPVHGPLGQELRLTLREQNMGLSTERALANMQARCETPSVRAFVRAVSPTGACRVRRERQPVGR